MKWLIIAVLCMPFVMASSEILADSATISDDVDLFQTEWLMLIIPVLLLFVTVISFAIDFGTVGVGTLASLTLILLFYIGVIPIMNPITLFSFIIIVMITVFKVTRTSI